MTSISVGPKDPLEGISKFNTWKVRVVNTLEESYLDGYISTVVEELHPLKGESKET